MSNADVMERVSKGHRMQKPEDCPEIIYKDVFLKCWIIEPKRRSTFSFIEDFFETYDEISYMEESSIK